MSGSWMSTSLPKSENVAVICPANVRSDTAGCSSASNFHFLTRVSFTPIQYSISPLRSAWPSSVPKKVANSLPDTVPFKIVP